MTAQAKEGTDQMHMNQLRSGAERRIVLRDSSDFDGTQHEEAVLTSDGELEIRGRDAGADVAAFWGSRRGRYEWVFTIAPGNVPALVTGLGGSPDDDVLEVLAGSWSQAGGPKLAALLRSEAIEANFRSWVG